MNFYNNNGGGRLFALLNLKAGDIVAITASGGLPTSATNGTYDSENSTEGTNCIYTVTSDGNFAVSFTRYYYIHTVTITRDLADLEAPTYTITGANDTQRQITLSCLTEGAAIKYNTVNDKAADGWTTYSSPFMTSEETLYAYSEKSGSTSDVITVTTGAGTILTLNVPKISRSGNSVTITSNQSNIVGAPTADIYYTYGGGEPVAYSGAITVTKDATIEAYASATGYTNSGNASRAVALFPAAGISEVENANKQNYTTGGLSGEEVVGVKGTYQTFVYDDTQWGSKIYVCQTGFGDHTKGWNFRKDNTWVNGSASSANVGWLMLKDMKAGDIIVFNVTSKGVNASNATYSEKYSEDNKHVYIVDADGNAEIGFRRAENGGNNTLTNISAYTHSVTGTIVGAFDCTTGDRAATSEKVTLKPGESYHYNFKNYNSGGNASWNNFVVLAYDANDVEKVAVRADNFEIHGWTNAGCSSDFNWSNFVSKMNGATVDMTLSYSTTNVFTMNATIITNETNPATWSYSYTSDYSGSGISLSGNIQVALSVDHAWLDVISAEQTVGVLTLNDSYYTTFSNAQKVQITGATAYVAKVDGEELVLTKVNDDNIVPAETGVILKGEYGVAVSYAVTGAGAEVPDNDLLPVLTKIPRPNDNIYVLYNYEFMRYIGEYLVAGKAYLDLTGYTSKLRMTFADDDATAINSVESEKADNGAIYNLAGQRVGKDYKGIVIKNGKKFMNK